jgi:hypothetical protein
MTGTYAQAAVGRFKRRSHAPISDGLTSSYVGMIIERRRTDVGRNCLNKAGARYLFKHFFSFF